MNWKEEYTSKLVSIEEAAKTIKSDDKIWVAGGTNVPVELVESLEKRVNELKNVELLSILLFHPFKFLQSEEFIGRINYSTLFYGPFARAYRGIGNTSINSVHLSNSHKPILDFEPNVFFSDVSEPDEDGYMYYGTMGGCLNWAAQESATHTVVQVNKHQPKIHGVEHRIHVSDVNVICEANRELFELPEGEISEIDKTIANYIIPMIEDGSTLQLGIGALANAIGYNLGDKKNLSMHTEMLTDSLVYLMKEGAISGKKVVSFGAGKKSLYEYVDNNKDIHFAPFKEINDPRVIGENDKMISINSTLMVDLTGQVSSESIGHKQFSCTGGQLDFVRGAGFSKGGKSFLCLNSTLTNKKGELQSKIVFTMPDGQIITTPRTDVMYIVTEYGIADMYCKSIPQRIEAMISIAHPDFRDELRAEAIENGMIRA